MKVMLSRFIVLAVAIGIPGLLWAGPVDVNSADAPTLAAELTGVGPAIAEEIVRDREANGRFETAEALMRVRGVGPRIIEMNRDYILTGAEQAE